MWGAALQRHEWENPLHRGHGMQPLTQKAFLPLPFPRSTNAPSSATQNDSEIKFVVVFFFLMTVFYK